MPTEVLPTEPTRKSAKKVRAQSGEQARPADALPWHRSTLGIGLLGSLLMYLALPPVDGSPLAWIAPVPWLMLIRRRSLPGAKPYRALWVAGFAFWFFALHWLRLPFWATAFGWLAASMYLALYIPAFVGLGRIAVHQLRIPLIAAAPTIWMGLELAKGHLLDGFTMGSLGHTQFRWIMLIQISDLAGAYGVAFVVMLVAACVARAIPLEGRSWAWWPALPAAAVVALTLWYGHYRTQGEYTRPGQRVALIQGSVDSSVKADPAKVELIWKEYQELSEQAARHKPDLIVWPETMFRDPLTTFPPGFAPSPDASEEFLEYIAAAPKKLREKVAEYGAPLLVGIDRHDFRLDRLEPYHYNSCVFVDRQGNLLGTYDKQILVMFGEYVPLADKFPWLYKLTPLPFGVVPGERPLSVELDGVRYAPNICFETVLPHLIAGHVRQLRHDGVEPDVLVNLTNDGWFRGSSELDMHLACGVFRAVECRKPLLVAANTGFSAWIDGDGRILAQGPRRAKDVLIADVRIDERDSPYVRYGDLPAGVALSCCIALAAVGGLGRLRRRLYPA